MTEKLKIIVIQQKIKLENKLEEYLGEHVVRLSFDDVDIKHLPEDTNMIAIYFNDVDQNLTQFLREIKSSKWSHIPLIALMDKIEESFTKNILKLGFSNYISLDTETHVICEDLKFYVETATQKARVFSRISVAIIDDDFLHNELIKRLLEANGVQKIHLYQNPEEFLAKSVEFDIFLVDLVLKKSNGIQLIKKISDAFPASLIFIMSSLSEDKIVATAYDAGADDFIFKPIKPSVFLSKIFARIRKKNAQQYINK